jgi:fused signal recognition particle receptor
MNTALILVIVAILAGVAAVLVWRTLRPSALPAGGLGALGSGDAETVVPDPAPPQSKSAVEPGNVAATGGLFAALSRTRELFAGLFGQRADERARIEALEEALVRADVGARTAARLAEEMRGKPDPQAALRDALLARLGPAAPLRPGGPPWVVLVVGVNGSGKTTTIGKLAARWKGEGRSVLLGAGDTFRAGAIEQLKVWGERAGVEVVAQAEGADPAAVAHMAVETAKARGTEVVICDTAGRLQAQKALMDELAKVRRVIGRIVPGAPHEVLLVLDATMGQNALSQARLFKDVAGVTGVALTKLDGTAKGGVVVAIAEEFGLPVKLIGVGEKVADLRDFDPQAFVDAMVGQPGATPAD